VAEAARVVEVKAQGGEVAGAAATNLVLAQTGTVSAPIRSAGIKNRMLLVSAASTVSVPSAVRK